MCKHVRRTMQVAPGHHSTPGLQWAPAAHAACSAARAPCEGCLQDGLARDQHACTCSSWGLTRGRVTPRGQCTQTVELRGPHLAAVRSESRRPRSQGSCPSWSRSLCTCGSRSRPSSNSCQLHTSAHSTQSSSGWAIRAAIALRELHSLRSHLLSVCVNTELVRLACAHSRCERSCDVRQVSLCRCLACDHSAGGHSVLTDTTPVTLQEGLVSEGTQDSCTEPTVASRITSSERTTDLPAVLVGW